MKYYDGTQWITLKGPGVDLTPAVSVDTTDCDIGPADSTGSFTKDGAEVDGVQKYKLDLTLPRPPVVTTSATEPDAATSCDGDFWVDETGGGIASDETYVPLKAYCYRNNSENKTTAKNISSYTATSNGKHALSFDLPMSTADYTVVSAACLTAESPTVRVAATFPLSRSQTEVQIYCIPVYGDYGYVPIAFFDFAIMEKET